MSRVTNAIEITAPQRSEQWFKARLGNVTGSQAKNVIRELTPDALAPAFRKLLGVKMLTQSVKNSPSYLELSTKNPFELLELAELGIPESTNRISYRKTRVAERLTGYQEDETFPSKAMQWGTINEPLAIAKYQMVTENVVDEAYFLLHPELRCGASPDGKVTDTVTGELGVLEVKCLNTHNHLYKILQTQKMPDDYFVQVQMEMWLANVDYCDFVGYDSRLPGKLDIFIERVKRDNDFIDGTLEPEIRAFLDEVDRDERRFRALIYRGFEFNLDRERVS